MRKTTPPPSRGSPAYLLLLLILVASVLGKDCGFPGRPDNGSTQSAEKFFYPGEEVTFECDGGFILFGKARRTCLDDGTWTDTLPECRYNLALKRTASQSETLWNYDANLAVDGDANTCSFTPQSDVQRWWQVHLPGAPRVGAVAVTMSPGSYQHFTIFVVELLEGNKAMYKPCAKFEGRFQDQKALFDCNENEGHSGQFVYLRDDREDKEYFGLCEVEVFIHKGHPQCGQPEQPIYGTVKIAGEFGHYSCIPGYTMRGNATRRCSWKGWEGQVPECTEVQCDHPESTKDGFIEVSNFKGSYVYGSRATYHCNPGFILWGNATRMCNAKGVWTGHTPQCKPIACGDPATFAHASVALLNGSTVWRAVAQYSCIHGYKDATQGSSAAAAVTVDPAKSNDNNRHLGAHNASKPMVTTESVCQQNGSWTRVQMSCVRDPSAGGANMNGQRSADGGFLVGANGGLPGGGGVYGSGTMMLIAVVAAVITGTAVAFLIIFVRKWLVKFTDSSSHHLIIAPGGGGGGGGGLGQAPGHLGPSPSNGSGGPNNGNSGSGPNGGSKFSSGTLQYSTAGSRGAAYGGGRNQYSTMPIMGGNGGNGGAGSVDKLVLEAGVNHDSGMNFYQTTTLSTFSKRGIASYCSPPLLPASARIVHGEVITANGGGGGDSGINENDDLSSEEQGGGSSSGLTTTEQRQNEVNEQQQQQQQQQQQLGSVKGKGQRRHKRQQRQNKRGSSKLLHLPTSTGPRTATATVTDTGLTTATSLSSSSSSSSSSSPSSPSSSTPSPVSTPSEGEQDDQDDEEPSMSTVAFRYADAKEIASASLKKSCLKPQKANEASPVRYVASNTLGRKRSSGAQQQNQVMNCFDPLFPPPPASDSIPDLLQNGQQQQQPPLPKDQLHFRSLTRAGHLPPPPPTVPRDILAVYAKRDRNSERKMAGNSNAQRLPSSQLIVNMPAEVRNRSAAAMTEVPRV